MRKQLIILTGCIYLISCSPYQNVSSTASGSHHPSENAVLWQQTAAEYDALCHQAFNIAKLIVQQKQQSNYKSINQEGYEVEATKPPAIIMDIDETILNNSPYYAGLVVNNKSFSDKSWSEWVASSSAELIPGAKSFINFVQEKGIEIFFISNRKEDELEATKRVLAEQGIIINPEFFLLKEDTKEKNNRRQRVMDTHNVIMFIGDDLTDFNDLFESNLNHLKRKEIVNNEFLKMFGQEYIILPNPIYGSWQESLKNPPKKGIKNSDQESNLRFLKTF